MATRFLTADDVRRAGAGEIVVAEGTLVTPQALEAARELGIEIRGGAGPYREPAPDRGPDATRAARSLPHLPEPSEDPLAGTGVVVTAVGRNRRGILAEITTTLNANGAGVQNVSQRVVEGYFHLILVVELDPGAPFEGLKTALECLGGPDDYAVRVMHERVFRYMHRI
ncbi:MAG TPA: ACT domain-containing protein [Planctomycetota bacterium]|nr:ACT domain-containing protein [Planctomycetota bacterium]